MKQFNKAEARLIFEQYPEAKYVAQDFDGEVFRYDECPNQRYLIWVCSLLADDVLIDQYALHPDGWENSRYSRADMEGE